MARASYVVSKVGKEKRATPTFCCAAAAVPTKKFSTVFIQNFQAFERRNLERYVYLTDLESSRGCVSLDLFFALKKESFVN